MRNINKFFLGNQILYGVNLQVNGGEVHGLIGPNGSGKSTIVNILSGIYQQDSGDILWDDEVLGGYSPQDTLQKGVFTLYQEPQLILELSIMDNLFAGHYEKKFKFFCDDKKMKKRTEEVLQLFDASLSPDRKVGELTKCEKEIVAVARAFLRKARLFVMDEPTAGMSYHEQQVVMKLIQNIKKSGSSVIYITHRLEEIRGICDRISIMRDGHIVMNTDMDKISDTCIENMMRISNFEENFAKKIVPTGNLVMEVTNLCKEAVYDNICISLHEGEILGIAGSVGSGRTALLKTLFGALMPESGTIRMDGELVCFKDIYDAIEHNIGYMPDDRLESGIIPDLTVLDNAMLTQTTRKKSFLKNTKKELETFIKYVVQPGYYLPSPSKAIKYASGGNQQKTIFFRWIVSESRILLLDEPTKGIDIVSKNEMYQLIFEKAQEGVSFIISSSDYKELQRLCTKILVLNHGHLEEKKKEENKKEYSSIQTIY